MEVGSGCKVFWSPSNNTMYYVCAIRAGLQQAQTSDSEASPPSMRKSTDIGRAGDEKTNGQFQMLRFVNYTPSNRPKTHFRSCLLRTRYNHHPSFFKYSPFLEDIAVLFKTCQSGQEIPRVIVSYEVMGTSLQTICKT